MPYIEGESLRDRLEREGQLPLEEALRITREVASARMIASSIAGGIAARIALTRGGAAARCWRTMLSALGPVKGGSPANISYSTHPRL